VHELGQPEHAGHLVVHLVEKDHLRRWLCRRRPRAGGVIVGQAKHALGRNAARLTTPTMPRRCAHSFGDCPIDRNRTSWTSNTPATASALPTRR